MSINVQKLQAMTLRNCRLGLGTLALVLQCAGSHAFPAGPLTLVVPFPPTGAPDIDGTPRITKLVKLVQNLSAPVLTDTLAQETGAELGARLEQVVRIERRAGTLGLDGAHQVAQALPDGRTLLFAGNQMLTIYPLLQHAAAGFVLREFLPVAQIAGVPLALVGEAGMPVHTVQQLVERAHTAKRVLNFSTLGDATTSHFTGEAFRRATGIRFVRVNYNGGTEALNAIAARNVDFGFVPLPAVLPFIGGGKLRVIAIASARRHPAVAATPTMVESGIADFVVEGWFGIFSPAHTPLQIVTRLNDELNQITADERFQRTLAARGLFALKGSAAGFAERIARDIARWSSPTDPVEP